MRKVLFFVLIAVQVAYGMDVEYSDKKKHSFFAAFEIGSRTGDYSTLKSFMEDKKFDINIREYWSNLTGFLKSLSKYVPDEIVNAFLADERVDITATAFEDSEDAIMLAFQNGRYSLVEQLIQSGKFNLSRVENYRNETIFDKVFSLAVHYKDDDGDHEKILSIAIILLNHKAFGKFSESDRKDQHFYSACEYGGIKFLEILIKHPSFDLSILGPKALYSACLLYRTSQEKAIAVTKLLLSSEKTNVNDVKFSPVIEACRSGAFDIAELLIADNRCDLNAVDNWTNHDGIFINACFSAFDNTKHELATAFISTLMKNPKINVLLIGKGTNNVGAVYVAAQIGNISMLKLLMSDPRFNISTAKQANSWRTLETPIFAAIETGHLDCANLLLDDPRCDFHEKCGSGLEAVSITYRHLRRGIEYNELFSRLVLDERFDIDRIDYLYREEIRQYIIAQKIRDIPSHSENPGSFIDFLLEQL